MAVFNNALAGAAGSGGADAAYEIERSLRFNRTDTPSLSKTFSSAGNQTTWTWSAWVKRVEIGVTQSLFSCYSGTDNNDGYVNILFNGQDKLSFSGWSSSYAITNKQFRDPSAWYHIVIAVDQTQSNASDRIKIYVNGVAETFDTYDASRSSYPISSAITHNIGSNAYYNSTTNKLHGYLAEVHFVDGLQLAETNFGEFDATTGVWNPIEYTGNYNAPSSTKHQGDWVGDTTGTAYNATVGIDKAFDGSTSTSAAASAGGTLTFTPSTAITGITKVRIFAQRDVNASSATLTLNGTDISSNWNLGDNIQVEITTNNLTSLAWTTQSNGQWFGVRTIEIYYDGAYHTLRSNVSVNGFHLDFSDNSSAAALGTDSSGSNNTWTVNNIAVTTVNYNSTLTAVDSNQTVTNPGNAFDGDTSTGIGGITGGIRFTPSGGSQSNVTSLRFYSKSFGQGGTIKLNGSTIESNYDFGNGGWYAFSSSALSNISNTLTSFEWDRQPGQGSNNNDYLFAIEINGSVLLNTGDLDIDSVIDSPTNYDDGTNIGGNYATFNFFDSENGTLSNGNLTTVNTNTSTSFGPQNTTIGVNSGKWYCEFTWDSGTYALVGITHAPSQGKSGTTWHRDADTYTWYFSGAFMSIAWPGTSTFPDGSNPTFTAGDVIGVLLDKDNDKLYFTKNGSYVASMNAATGTNGIDISAHSGKTAFFTAGNNAGTATQWSLNTGQLPFNSTPPTDYKALCSQNLDNSLLPSTGFQTKLWTGNQSARSIATTGMSPDLVWIKSRSHQTWHELFDTVRGPLNQLYSNESNQEANTASTLTAFNDDGFSLGDNNGVNGANTRTYVGWAWDVGSNSDRTYTVTVVSDSGNKYRFDGHGTSAVTLDLEEGSTYTFDQSDSSNSGHPLRFSTTSDGTHGGGSEYTTGVTTTGTPGTAGAKTTIVVASGAPTLYYYCNAHSGMGGQINTNSTAGSTALSGSLNSIVYNTSSTWRNNWTASGNGFGSNPVSNIFDANFDNYMNNDAGGQYITWNTTSYTLSGELLIDVSSSSGVYDIYVNGSKAADTSSSRGWVNCGTFADINEIQFAGTSYGTSDNLGSAGVNVYGIKVGGKRLIDSDVTPTDVPLVTSTVRANPSTGCSIITYTGTQASGSTVAHGLNKAPEFYVMKCRSHAGMWVARHKDVANTHYMQWDDTAEARNAVSDVTGDADATSTVIPIGAADANNSGRTHVAYCWAPVDGFSAMGSFGGTSDADGPFIYTGFRPSWIMIKNTTTGGYPWHIYDDERDGYNFENLPLYVDLPDIEGTSGFADILSNGFKIRSSSQVVNTTGDTYIWMAFASDPFKTARAR